MIAIRQRLLRAGPTEGGFTLVEVLVAMFVFTLVSVGVLYTMMSLLSVTRDSRNRQVATNLAAQEIDLARDINNIFDVETIPPKTIVLNGQTFYVTRDQEWVYSDGEAAACGTGVGALRYKLVQVEVTWLNMRGDGVTSETFINPNSRINDPLKGSLIVSATTLGGDGVENVSVVADPTGAGSNLTQTTDADGCAFFLGVVPGAFTITITAPPSTTYVDITGATSPSKSATVVAASAASVPFTYDPAGTLRATYISSSTKIPLNMPTSLLSTRDPVASYATTAANPRSFLVSPWGDGYSVVAGDALLCDAADPGRWLASGSLAEGERPEPVSALSGTTTDVTVPMGTVTVTGMGTTGGSNQYLVAVSKAAAQVSGEPPCGVAAATQLYRFAPTTTSSMVVALPYGSWDLYKGTTSSFVYTSGTKLGSSSMTAGPGGTVSSGVLTIDPRGPA